MIILLEHGAANDNRFIRVGQQRTVVTPPLEEQLEGELIDYVVDLPVNRVGPRLWVTIRNLPYNKVSLALASFWQAQANRIIESKPVFNRHKYTRSASVCQRSQLRRSELKTVAPNSIYLDLPVEAASHSVTIYLL